MEIHFFKNSISVKNRMLHLKLSIIPNLRYSCFLFVLLLTASLLTTGFVVNHGYSRFENLHTAYLNISFHEHFEITFLLIMHDELFSASL